MYLAQIFCITAAVLALVNAAEVKEENDVLVLDKSNFQEVVTEKDTTLVEFYAPWCGHCKSLEPHYAAAAKQLKAKGVALAKVDATKESGLAGDYNVEGYPTLKIFKKSLPGDSFDYEGPRDTDGIVSFMEDVAKPTWKPPFKLSGLLRLTKENISEALDKQEFWLVGFVDSSAAGEGGLPALRGAAGLLKRGRDSRAVGFLDAGDASDVALATELSLGQPPSFGVVRRGGRRPAAFGHSLSAENLEKFYRAHSSQAAPTAGRFAAASELDGVNDGLEPLLVGRFDSEEAGQFLANFLLESGYFYNRRLEGGFVTDAGLAKRLGMATNRIYLLRAPKLLAESESRLVEYDGGRASEELKAFYDANSLPLVGHWSWSTKDEYRRSAKPVCLLLLTVAFRGEQLPATRRWHAKFSELAKAYAGRILFAMADDEGEEELVKSFRLEESSADVNVGCYDSEKRRYAMPEADSYEPDEVRQFLDDLLAGRLSPVVRSVTARAAAAAGPVRELTGDTFDKLVLKDSAKHSLVLMCSVANQPCSHSLKEFAAAADSPEAVELGVQFCKLDTKLNDAPGNYYYKFNAEDLEMTQPQLLLGLKNNKLNPIRYPKEVVSKDYVLKFLRENVKAGAKTEL